MECDRRSQIKACLNFSYLLIRGGTYHEKNL